MKAHFVEFMSPGTFFSESTVKPIKHWCPKTAMQMARGIKERYGATPYGFRFLTRQRADDELDSKIVETSHTYFLGGKIETLAEVEARNDPKESILVSNMRGNGIKRVITNTNSWKATLPFGDKDVLLEWKP